MAALAVTPAQPAARGRADASPLGPSDDPVIAAAGDIACDPGSPAFNGGRWTGQSCRQRAVSNLLVDGDFDAILTLGDDQYDDGQLSKFKRSYAKSWGRVKGITYPAPGNHDYGTAGAAGYFDYFGAAAGSPGKGYYSFDVGSWHLIALNSNCGTVACDEGSAQRAWLKSDLAASEATCTLAYWHHPRFSSEPHGDDLSVAPLWRVLYRGGADIVLNGHDHDYERFGPQAPSGKFDSARGIREFVVGTGGESHYPIGSLEPHSRAHDSSSFGVLELALHPAGYSWRFVPAAGGTFTDGGRARCH